MKAFGRPPVMTCYAYGSLPLMKLSVLLPISFLKVNSLSYDPRQCSSPATVTTTIRVWMSVFLCVCILSCIDKQIDRRTGKFVTNRGFWRICHVLFCLTMIGAVSILHLQQ
jgi:hypothetical protein